MKPRNHVTPFLEFKEMDLFLFTGSQPSHSSFENEQGVRSFIEHFEEYVRWEKTKDTEYLREKYVITHSNPNQKVEDLANRFNKEIALYEPSVLLYFISPSDYLNGTQGSLSRLLKQVLQLKNNQAKFVLQYPWKTANETENKHIEQYILSIEQELLASLEEPERKRVFIVDNYRHLPLTDYVNELNQLNGEGHLKLGEYLVQSLYGTAEHFPGVGVTLDLMFKEEQLVYSKPPNPLDQRLKKLLDKDDPLTWLFMGDSITHGALWTYGYKDYVELFRSYIEETLHRPKDIFINTAVSGATIPSTLARIGVRLQPYHPDIIYMKLGANDVVHYTATEYKENLETMLRHLKEKNALIILSTPTPSDLGIDKSKRMREYIRVLYEIAVAYPEIILIDQYTVMQDYLEENPIGWRKEYTFYTDEVLHLGANGHLFMFHNLTKQLGLIHEESPYYNYYYVSEEEDALIVKDVFDTLHK